MRLGNQSFFITGVAGFIGSHLAENLASQGATVIGIDNLSKGRIENIRHLWGDTPTTEACGIFRLRC